MRLQSHCFAGLLFAVIVTMTSPAPARPYYKKVFEDLYPKFQKRRTSCAICHPERSKKTGNHYSDALMKALDDRNVKDRKIIRKALKAIEDQGCTGIPWKQLLDRGIPPCLHRSGSRIGQNRPSLIERLLEQSPDQARTRFRVIGDSSH